MEYKASDIKPKRYPDEKPSIDDKYWVFATMHKSLQPIFIDFEWAREQDMWSWHDHVLWFIDIPGAPSELKPLKYPEDSPKDDGWYWVHLKITDSWDNVWWDRWTYYWHEYNVDYFIPYRLDKENEMENGITTHIIYDSHDITASYYAGKSRIMIQDKFHRFIDPNAIGTTTQEFTAFARHWLDLQGYEVTRKEPEIKACPFCGSSCFVIDVDDGYQVLCSHCEYKSRILYYSGRLKDTVKHEIIRLHNLIADNPRRNGEE